MLRKFLVGVLASAMALSVMTTFSVNAQEMENIELLDNRKMQDNSDAIASGDYEYIVNADGTAMICGYTGEGTNMIIPSHIDGLTVTSIDSTLNGVYREVTAITIPATVTFIKEGAFWGCPDLSTIIVEDGNVAYKVVDGALFSMDGTTLMRYPSGNKAHSYAISYGVTDIGENAFDEAGRLRNITIPESVINISSGAFWGCDSLESIILLEHIKNIEAFAFYGCSSLRNVVVPETITDMRPGLFESCSNLESVTIPVSVKYIGMWAFYECESLKDIYYEGSASEWREVNIYSYNEDLENATIHYKYIDIPSLWAQVKEDSVTLIWGDVDGAESYKIYRADSMNDEKVLIGTCTETSFVDVNVEKDKTYYYYAVACNEENESGYSEVLKVTVQNYLEKFVERMYTVALDRESDVNGKADWVGQLENGTADAAFLAFGFIRSEEFTNRNLDDVTYLTVLYRTFFDREPDDIGMADWMSQLSTGASREYVLASFVNSDECMNLCNSFEIERGYMKDDGSVVNVGISKFVGRLYTKVLGRMPEAGGYNDWISRIINGVIVPGDAPANFFGSAEYVAKNKSNEAFVYDLYATFFDRAPANGEELGWIEQIEAGTERSDIIPGFANSQEFANLLTTFGL